MVAFCGHLLLPVFRVSCLDSGVPLLLALIDLGAEDNLLDQELAVQAGLRLEELKKSIFAYVEKCEFCVESASFLGHNVQKA